MLRKWPRVVFPLSTPAGDIVGLYSRAVDKDYPKTKAPKELRHDVVGRRGLFNAMEGLAKARLCGALYVTEGCFDCLAMIEAGYLPTVALVGTDGLPWQWLQGVRWLYLCLDRDKSGLAKAQSLADQAALRGISAYIPEDDEYGGYGEPSEQYEATGMITLGGGDEDLLF
ncbi:MAG: toprim domain-containing protein [Dehalococcoidia bacterium]|nr:toprim domain-containing protein [Dehalococcoidia bacterium]